MVTENPLACKSFASDADKIPFPNEDVTPPVTNIYLVDKLLNFLVLAIKAANIMIKRVNLKMLFGEIARK